MSDDSPRTEHSFGHLDPSRRTVLKGIGGGVGLSAIGGLSFGTVSASHGSFVHILSVDTSRWSTDAKIFTNLQVDTEAGNAGDLTQDDFTVFQDGVEQTLESFSFSSPKADIVFVFDDTGSMGGEIADMKAGVKDLTDGIEAAGTDARYGLVSFKDSVEVDQTLTDASTLKTAVDALSASGGDDFQEDDFDAIIEALGLGFRSDAQKVIVDITDADSHFDGDGSGVSDSTMSDVESALTSAGAVYVAISPHPDDIPSGFHEPDGNKKILADNIGGKWFDIASADFSVILDELLDFLTSLYVLDWSTCLDPGTSVPVEVVVEDPAEGTGSHTSTLTIPADAELPPQCRLVEVAIDIKPGSDPNAINPNGKGNIPVAIQHTDDYDPTDPSTGVDVSTLRFGAPDVVDGGGGATPAHDGHIEDWDNDGDDDLIVHFPTPDAGFEKDDTEGKLVGKTIDGLDLEGSDTVKTAGNGGGGSSS